MRIASILIFAFCTWDIYSQAEYFNHNDCDKYTIRNWDHNVLDSLSIPKVKDNFSLSEFHDFKDSIDNLTIIQYVKSNILINRLILFDECFTKNCTCNYMDNLDTIYQVFSNRQARIKLIGYFKPFPKIYSVIVLYQLKADSTDETIEMNSYLINLNESYKVISTVFIGHLNRSNDGFSVGEYNPDILINGNIITLKSQINDNPVKDGWESFPISNLCKKTYNIRTKKDGQVEVIE